MIRRVLLLLAASLAIALHTDLNRNSYVGYLLTPSSTVGDVRVESNSMNRAVNAARDAIAFTHGCAPGHQIEHPHIHPAFAQHPMPQSCRRCFPRCTINGYDFFSFATPIEANCCWVCRLVAQCKAFAYNLYTGACTLYTSVENRTGCGATVCGYIIGFIVPLLTEFADSVYSIEE